MLLLLLPATEQESQRCGHNKAQQLLICSSTSTSISRT
jgi:hypothetical protein